MPAHHRPWRGRSPERIDESAIIGGFLESDGKRQGGSSVGPVPEECPMRFETRLASTKDFKALFFWIFELPQRVLPLPPRPMASLSPVQSFRRESSSV